VTYIISASLSINIWMPFEMVSGVGRRMGVLHCGPCAPRGRGSFVGF